MTDNLEPHFTLLDELDARQDGVIAALDELNTRIESLLRSFSDPAPEAQVPAVPQKEAA